MTIGTDKLPQSWKGVRLGNVCKVVNGSGFKTSYQGYDSLPIPFIKVSDMNMAGNEKIVSRAANTVNTNMLKELKAKTCPAGSVIFPKVGGAVFTNKKRLLGTEAAFDNNIMGVVPLGVSSEWLFYWFQTVDLSTLANLSALPSIKTSVIKDLEILIPSLPEQQCIAGILNQQMAYVEKARKAAEEILEAAQALPGAFLRQAFPAHGDALPAGWKWVKLKEVGVFKSGGTPSKKRADYWHGEIPFVTGADITELYISKSNARAFLTREGFDSGRTVVCKAGTVLIVTRTRVGRIGIAQEAMGASQDITAFECGDQINQEFLYWYLHKNSDHLIDNSRGSTIQGLTRKFVANIRIPLPPLSEQKRIAALLNQQMAYVETVRMSAREQLDAINALPAALLRRAFAGGL